MKIGYTTIEQCRTEDQALRYAATYTDLAEGLEQEAERDKALAYRRAESLAIAAEYNRQAASLGAYGFIVTDPPKATRKTKTTK
jgi:thiamine biosynthesis protein ThiC